ncbi:MAG: hypothetical protein BHV69_02285 [Bacteroidales bacterium 52_46]|nr:MAG: hypothetical protein BHV69_02285 [Bacteroidales bacterium 52_46]
MIVEIAKLFGREVIPITTLPGQKGYYGYMNYWRSCVYNTNLRILPTEEEVSEYLNLKEENPSMFGRLEERKRYNKLQAYENNYDWRPCKSGEAHSTGLVSPTGEQLLPNNFEDIFIQFDAVSDKPDFVPVSNGEGWALVSLGPSPVLMTEFCYTAIIPERWERRMFFVQDYKTMKWGVLRAIRQSINAKPRDAKSLVTIESLMPCIADDIYEDDFMVDDPEEMPSMFFMLRIGNKVGILTDYGYSKIIYDSYETDSRDCSFQLIRNDRKRAHRADWWRPDGKDLKDLFI